MSCTPKSLKFPLILLDYMKTRNIHHNCDGKDLAPAFSNVSDLMYAFEEDYNILNFDIKYF